MATHPVASNASTAGGILTDRQVEITLARILWARDLGREASIASASARRAAWIKAKGDYIRTARFLTRKLAKAGVRMTDAGQARAG